MKSNLQPIKLFLILGLSCTSLLVSETSSLGGGFSDRSHSKMVLAQTPPSDKEPVPPRGNPGGRVRGGATRGDKTCPAAKPDLTAIVPYTEEADGVVNVWAQTTLERPSWFFYVPYTKNVAYAVEFVLQDNTDSTEIYRTTIAPPDKPGVIRVSLPNTVPALPVNKEYRWFFSINCDPEKNAPWTYVEGVIQRVNLNQSTAKELENADPLKRYAIYAQKGLVYEALATLAELQQKNPKDTAVQTQWQNLVTSIRLDDVAKEPLLFDKP
ncbi:MAG: DUF928 domain-containing protein [Nostoc sp. ChiSLP02]|nr:DUF928 domain-containing protein [Nostoc sp. DedSLP05]MDZ8100056.1 DUF928 domain-containing protein [Nostoc sp. DedSLP01]MDZ8186613.1 DUF928 domain-containing protein [Nostoc sp. ChiSLP02]